MGSRFLKAAQVFTNITCSVPFFVPPHLIWFLTSKFSMAYSNFPGNKNGYNWGGHMVRSITAFSPTIGANVNGIICLTVGDILTLGFITSSNYIK